MSGTDSSPRSWKFYSEPRRRSWRGFAAHGRAGHIVRTVNCLVSRKHRKAPFRLTLHEVLQPPPGSSTTFGGFHVQDQSKVTVWLPPVVKSPISSTLEFLWRFGSAWNSLVTSVSTSRGVEA